MKAGWSLGAQGAQQLIGAALADPGRGRDLAGGQPAAAGPLLGDQLADPGATVPRPGAVAGAGLEAGQALLRPGRTGGSGRRSDRGAALLLVAALDLLGCGGRGGGPVAVRQAGAGHTHQQLQRPQQSDRGQGGEQLGGQPVWSVGDVQDDETAVAAATRDQAYQGSRQASPRR
jgi:hypothetical protein